MAGIDAERFRSPAAPSRQPPGYADPQYWEARYAETTQEAFDWYLKWDQLKDLLQKYLPAENSEAAQILIVGCGTSTLGEQLYAAGYVNVMNIDRCAPLIDVLQEKHQDKAPMEYHILEAHSLPQEWTGRFDLVVDKAMLDSVACGRDKRQQVRSILRCISRVLKPSTGIFVSVSHAGPTLRTPVLLNTRGTTPEQDESQEFGWKLSQQTVARPLSDPAAAEVKGAKDAGVKLEQSLAFNADEHVYYIYVCQKL